jgi:hypothetical protein
MKNWTLAMVLGTAVTTTVIGLGVNPASAAIVTFTDEFIQPFETCTILGCIPTGTATWNTKVELIVPKTTFQVGEIGSFTILGNITNSATGAISTTSNIATIFGTPGKLGENNVELAQPFKSTIKITDPKIFVGPGNNWAIRAFDQVSTGTTTFSGTIPGVGASYTSTVQGPSVEDWFEPIGISNQEVRIENRVLSASDHGKFTGTGASFKIDGFFRDLAPGTATLSFNSQVNYTLYGLLAPAFFKNTFLNFKPFNLSIPVTSVPEPSSTLSLLALGTLGAASTLKRKLKPSQSTEKETTKVG